MNILITGGFGNIGISVIEECLRRRHTVTVFDLENARNKRIAKKYLKRSVVPMYGDIRNLETVERAIEGQDAIIHLAAILPPLSDSKPQLCKEVNIGGIENILEAIETQGNKTALIEVSSASVMGPTQDRQPPVMPSHGVSATDTYSASKIEAERLVESSKATYCILRLAGVLPTNLGIPYFLSMIKLMFDLPLKARGEFVLDVDVATALVSAAEDLCGRALFRSKKGFLGGGSLNGFQLTNEQMLKDVFNQVGLRFPRAPLFSCEINSYYLDWYDTSETQALFSYQNHSFEGWKDLVRVKLAKYRVPIVIFQKPILYWLEKLSKNYSAEK